jgi:hypothetical protein
MPSVCVGTELFDSDEAVEFGEIIGDPDAWRYLVRLWAWGIDKDREDGVVNLPAWKIARVVDFPGDPDLLWRGLTTPLGLEGRPWLQALDGGGHYMRGWEAKNGRYFREKNRLRNYRQKKKNERDAKRDVHACANGTETHTRRETQSQSLSPSPSHPPSQSQSQSLNTDRVAPVSLSAKSAQGPRKDVLDVIRAWHEQNPEDIATYHAGTDAWRRIVARLDDDRLPVDLVADAARGLKIDRDDPGGWSGRRSNYGLKYAVKDIDSVNKFAGYWRDGIPPEGNDLAAKNAEAARQWAESDDF